MLTFFLLQDFNDNAPKFVRPPRNFTIRVYENASVGFEVIRVKAVDTDVGLNGAVRYRIRKDPLGNHRSFRVDAESGAITLARYSTCNNDNNRSKNAINRDRKNCRLCWYCGIKTCEQVCIA